MDDFNLSGWDSTTVSGPVFTVASDQFTISCDQVMLNERRMWQRKLLDLLDDPTFREAVLNKLMQDAVDPNYPRV